jgi:malonate-semialdehyde dehydrogenase (acetylating)/methylmalonate-semialdehyde dehydrogenase
MTYNVPHIIGGQTITSGSRTLDIYNPATGTLAGNLKVADQAIVEQAVASAKAAFPKWSATTAHQRAKIMFRYKSLLDQHINELGALVTREHGKTLLEAVGSTQRGIDVLDFVCGMPSHLKGEFAEEVSSGVDCYSLRQPLGVCVGITPFNFPAMIPLWMFPMAIACGNTFVLKPSEKDPSCPLRLVELAKEAGVPDGVINIVQGDKETVDALLVHPDVKAVSFVGSSAVAQSVYQTAIMHGKRAQAFGGAKNHCVVMPDADMEQTAAAVVMSAYGSSGERCMAVSVVIAVGDQVADQLIEKMRPKITAIKVGDGTSDKIDMGPLVTKQHLERVQSYVELGVKEGAKLIIDGSKQTPGNAGYFMGAYLFDHVKPGMRIYKEEIFGPVLSIVRVPDFETALKLVNEHEYGNGTSIYTSNGYLARVFAEKVQAGMVGINVAVPVPVPQHSFGGWKQSIFADIGMYGAEAIRFYTKLKTVTQRWYPGGSV